MRTIAFLLPLLACTEPGYRGYEPLIGWFGSGSVERGYSVRSVAAGDRHVLVTVQRDGDAGLRFLRVAPQERGLEPVQEGEPGPFVPSAQWVLTVADGPLYVALAHRGLAAWRSLPRPPMGSDIALDWPEHLGFWELGSADYGDFVGAALHGEVLWVVERPPGAADGLPVEGEAWGWLHRVDLAPTRVREAPVASSVALSAPPTGVAVTEDFVWVSAAGADVLVFAHDGTPLPSVLIGMYQGSVVANAERAWAQTWDQRIHSLGPDASGAPALLGASEKERWMEDIPEVGGSVWPTDPLLRHADREGWLFVGGESGDRFVVLDGREPNRIRYNAWMGPSNTSLGEGGFQAMWGAWGAATAGRSVFLAADEGGVMLWTP